MTQQKRDIQDRQDLEELLRTFYTRAFDDDLIGRFFTEVVPLDLRTHIPVITDFWESVIFNKHNYRKNVMQIHQHIHQLSSIKKDHLDRWVLLFTGVIDEGFDGEKATLMKHRARSIATMMDIKLNAGMHNQMI
jgi:hemoglobin